MHIRDSDGQLLLRRELERDLTDYTAAWLGDLDIQGFLDPHSRREVLG